MSYERNFSEEQSTKRPIAEPSYSDRVKQIAEEFIGNLSPLEILDAVGMIMGMAQDHWHKKVEDAKIKAKELQEKAEVLFK